MAFLLVWLIFKYGKFEMATDCYEGQPDEGVILHVQAVIQLINLDATVFIKKLQDTCKS